jgi:hypothetical protein
MATRPFFHFSIGMAEHTVLTHKKVVYIHSELCSVGKAKTIDDALEQYALGETAGHSTVDGGRFQLPVPFSFERDLNYFAAWRTFEKEYPNAAAIVCEEVEQIESKIRAVQAGDFPLMNSCYKYIPNNIALMWGKGFQQTAHIDSHILDVFGIVVLCDHFVPTKILEHDKELSAHDAAVMLLGKNAGTDNIFRLKRNHMMSNYSSLILPRRLIEDNFTAALPSTPFGTTYFVGGGVVHAAPEHGMVVTDPISDQRTCLFFSCTPESNDAPYNSQDQWTKITLLVELNRQLKDVGDSNAPAIGAALSRAVFEYRDMEPWTRYPDNPEVGVYMKSAITEHNISLDKVRDIEDRLEADAAAKLLEKYNISVLQLKNNKRQKLESAEQKICDGDIF